MKNRRGRPPLSSTEPTVRFDVKLPASLLAKASLLAELRGRTLSGWVRNWLADQVHGAESLGVSLVAERVAERLDGASS